MSFVDKLAPSLIFIFYDLIMIIFYASAVLITLMVFLYIVVGIAMFFEPTDNISDDELPSYMSAKDL